MTVVPEDEGYGNALDFFQAPYKWNDVDVSNKDASSAQHLNLMIIEALSHSVDDMLDSQQAASDN